MVAGSHVGEMVGVITMSTRMDFGNATELSTERLRVLFEEGLAGWSVGDLKVRVRYSRGADFSGTCFYADRCIYVNIGRHLVYPYKMGLGIAKARTVGPYWFRSRFWLVMRDGYQLALFIFMHEVYHQLVYSARRNVRRKESMCDRFATKHLVDRFGMVVRDDRGRAVPRETWDFQDLEGFVAAARGRRVIRTPVRRAGRQPR